MDRNFLDAASTVGGFGLSAVVAPPSAEAAGAALSTIVSAGSPDADSTFGLLFRLFFFARTAISTSSDSFSAFLVTRFFGMRVVLVAPPTLASSTITLSLLLGFVFLDFDFLL